MTQVNKTVSPLRQRMIDDMNMRKLSPKTQIGYIRTVAKLANLSSPNLVNKYVYNTGKKVNIFIDQP